MEVITNSAREEFNYLTKDDVVIVCGGVNSIAKNESSKELTYMTRLIFC
jgi:hypothetical protein